MSHSVYTYCFLLCTPGGLAQCLEHPCSISIYQMAETSYFMLNPQQKQTLNRGFLSESFTWAVIPRRTGGCRGGRRRWGAARTVWARELFTPEGQLNCSFLLVLSLWDTSWSCSIWIMCPYVTGCGLPLGK